jgi:hypothetical protein
MLELLIPSQPSLMSVPPEFSVSFEVVSFADAWVKPTVWLSLIGWFVGSAARQRCRGGEHSGGDQSSGHDVPLVNRWRLLYGWSWLIGAVLVWGHIVASYALVHHWDHAAAIEATARQSAEVTGIRAGWGVYVNFVFAAVWLAYSLLLLRSRRLVPWLDRSVFWFTAAIVFSAAVVFESGAVRFLTMAAFVALLVAARFFRRIA